MRSVALAALLALSVVACKKKPDPAQLASAAASAVAVPAAVPASTGASMLSGFEGRIRLAARGHLGGGADKPLALDLTIQIKDGKIRLDVPPGIAPGADTGPVYLLIEPETKKIHAVMEAKKQALLIDLDKLAPQLEAMAKSATGATGAGGGSGTSAKPMPSGTKTGKEDTVAGYKCEIWQVMHEGKKMELCVLTDEKAWMKLPEAALPPQLSWAKELADGRHVPLRYVAFGPDGKESGRVELTAVERTTLTAAAFEVPKGFIIMSFDQMMAGLGGLLGGGPGLPGMTGLPPGLKLLPGMQLPPGLALPSGMPAPPKRKGNAGSAKPPKP